MRMSHHAIFERRAQPQNCQSIFLRSIQSYGEPSILEGAPYLMLDDATSTDAEADLPSRQSSLTATGAYLIEFLAMAIRHLFRGGARAVT